MWLRQEKAPAAKPAAAADSQPDSPAAAPAADLAAVRERSGREMSRIGKSLRIRGELTGSEDLHVDGEIDGEIELHDGDLLIGPNGSVRARAKVRSFIVWGKLRRTSACRRKGRNPQERFADRRDGGGLHRQRGRLRVPRQRRYLETRNGRVNAAAARRLSSANGG